MVGHRIDSQTGEIYHHSNQLFDHFFLSTNVNVLKQAIHSTAGCETTHYINSTKSCITVLHIWLVCHLSNSLYMVGHRINQYHNVTSFLEHGVIEAVTRGRMGGENKKRVNWHSPFIIDELWVE
eukprot:769979_1